MRNMIITVVAFAAVFVLVAGLSTAAPPAPATENYSVDPVHSAMYFRVKHLGVSYSYGRFNDISGTVVLDEKDPAKGSVAIEVKAASVDTHEEKRDQHLRGPDFLNAKEFPTIAFKSTSIKVAEVEEDDEEGEDEEGEDEDGVQEVYEVTGDLTLHGVTRPITVTVDHVGSGKDPWGGFRAGFEVEFDIKRSDFGMTALPEAVGDEINIYLTVEGVRK